MVPAAGRGRIPCVAMQQTPVVSAHTRKAMGGLGSAVGFESCTLIFFSPLSSSLSAAGRLAAGASPEPLWLQQARPQLCPSVI